MPGVRLRIDSPQRLEDDPPQHVLLLAWNLEQEILRQQASYCRQGGSFLVPIPRCRFV